jgi:hypothetical protein
MIRLSGQNWYYILGKNEWLQWPPPSCGSLYLNTVKPVLRGHLWEKEKNGISRQRWPLNRGSIYIIFYMTGEEQCDLSIQVTCRTLNF